MIRIIITIQFISIILNAQNWHIHGAVKSMMNGDLRARFYLQDIKGKQNVYGLGALENLR